MKILIPLAAALMALPVSALAADAPAVVITRAKPAYRTVLVCPDTHCGQRAYPDPTIANGWFGSDRGPLWPPDVRTQMLLRSWPLHYEGAASPPQKERWLPRHLRIGS